MLLLLTIIAVATATHYRYATMTYTPIGSNTIRFQLDQAYRRSFFAPVLELGQTFSPGSLDFGDGHAVNIYIVVVR